MQNIDIASATFISQTLFLNPGANPSPFQHVHKKKPLPRGHSKTKHPVFCQSLENCQTPDNDDTGIIKNNSGKCHRYQ